MGAYLDEKFTDDVLDELFGHPLRAVAPSYGFDVVTVAKHCLAARRRRRVRDAAITVIGVAMLLTGPVQAAVIGLLWWSVGRLVSSRGHRSDRDRETAAPDQVDARGGRPDEERRSGYGLDLRSIVQVLLVVAVLATTAVVVSISSRSGAGLASPGHPAVKTAPQPRVPGLGTGGPGRTGLSSVLTWSPPAAMRQRWLSLLIAGGVAAIAGWLVLYAIETVSRVLQGRMLLRDLRPNAFRERPAADVPMARRLRKRLARIEANEGANVTIYHGRNPFIGCGWPLPGWSFATALVPAPGHESDVRTFTIVELVEHVKRHVDRIAGRDGAPYTGPLEDSPLPGLAVSEHVFVNGLATPEYERIVSQREYPFVEGNGHAARPRWFRSRRPEPPPVILSEYQMRDIAGAPRGPVRHYCCAQVQSWQGEVVVSVFFHFSIDGGKLYFECVKRVLLPIEYDYHWVDLVVGGLSAREIALLATEAAVEAVPIALAAPVNLVKDVLFDLRPHRPPQDRVIDYGARRSVRELGSEDDYYDYFQDLDVDKHAKIVERRVFTAVREFLHGHHLDTTEFSRAQTTILNRGILQIGRGHSIVNAAVGDQSRVLNTGNIDVNLAQQEAQEEQGP